MIKLNETPIRTSRNFNINNIKLEDINISKEIKSFDNIQIIGDITVSDKILERKPLTFGIENELENQTKNKNMSIDIDKKIETPILINFSFDENNKELVEQIEIIAEEKSKANIILKYTSKENIDIYHNGILKIHAKDNSYLNITIINLLSEKANNFMSIENNISNESKVDYCIIDLGGRNSITNYYSNLEGKLAQNNINTIYLGKENQLLDLNYIGELQGEKSSINIEVQGALKDNAKKHFKGTIDFKKGSKKAKGNENEFCMLLSNTAKSLGLPMLLCSEEDVEGNHSSAAGKVDEKQLFYIMSRGFNYKEAMKLIVKAKFNTILENIKDESLKNEIILEIDKRLD